MWYYSENTESIGPVKLEELKAKFSSGELPQETLVWTAGMADWVPATTLPQFAPPASKREDGSMEEEFAKLEELENAPPTPLKPVLPALKLKKEPELNTFKCSVCGKGLQPSEVFKRGTLTICQECINADYAYKSKSGNFRRDAFIHAAFMQRVTAYILDTIFISIIVSMLHYIILRIFPSCPTNFCGYHNIHKSPWILLLVYVYRAVSLAAYSATPGKMLVHLHVAKPDGEALKKYQCFLRPLAFLFSTALCFIGHLVALCDEDNRALHDYICNTRVFDHSKDG